MRTKTLLLSGVVAALTSASLMAQVYSLNAVGYINVTCPPGFSVIANQLNTTNNNLSPLLDSQIDASGSHDNVNFFKFNGATYGTLTTDSLNLPASPWDGPATTTTLNPGEACFVQNPYSTNLVFTFVGTVLQGLVTNNMPHGFSLISSMIPQAGRLDADLGMPEVDNDNVFLFNHALGHYDTYTGDSLNLPQSPWDGPTGTNPVVTVGQGFFYQSGTAGGTNWIRNFNVN
jgi:hypothetical protein